MFRFLRFLCVYCVVLSANVVAQTPTKLSVGVNSPGTPPYLYYDAESSSYQGIIVDILKQAEDDGVLRLEFIDSHRSRSEWLLGDRKIDTFFSSLEWIDNPRGVIATDRIFKHASYLYSATEFADDFMLSMQTDAIVCTRRGYSYPSLEKFFAEGKLKRLDSGSHITMLRLLVMRRCDFAEIDSLNAQALMQNHLFDHVEIFQHQTPTSVVDAALLLHPSQSKQRDLLNHYIKAFLNSEYYEMSVAKHIKNIPLYLAAH